MALASAVGIGAERRWAERAQAVSRGVLKLMLFGIAPVVYFVSVNALELDASTGLGILAGWLALAGTGAIAYSTVVVVLLAVLIEFPLSPEPGSRLKAEHASTRRTEHSTKTLVASKT